jgi:hypothetical protein
MRISTNWQNFTIELDGATFTVRPLTVGDKLASLNVMGEVATIGAANIWKLSPQARADVVSIVTQHIVGWKGVFDDRGQELAFEPQLIERHIDAEVALHLFFLIQSAANVSEQERKNSSTASKSGRSAPDISTVDDAAKTAPIPAENQAA